MGTDATQAQAQTSGAIPSSGPPAQSAFEYLTQLDTQKKALGQQQIEAFKAMAAGTTQINPTAPNIHHTPDFEAKPLDNKRVIGAGNAKGQGISNIVTATANIVGKYVTAHKQQEEKSLTQKITTMYGAMDGVQQAEAALKANPEDADAKGELQHNQNVINAIMVDPKSRKSIAKALNINFTDPSQNNTPEHKAGQAAANSYAQQLAAQTPTKQVPNEEAKARAELIQKQLDGVNKSIDETIKVGTAALKDQTTRDNAIMHEQGANDRKAAELQARKEQTAATIQGNFERATTVARMNKNARMAVEVYKANANYTRTMDAINKRQELANGLLTDTGPLGSPKAIAAKNKRDILLQQQYKMLEKSKANSNTQIAMLINIRDSGHGKNVPPQAKEGYNAQIRQYESHALSYQNKQDEIMKQLDGDLGGSNNVSTTSNGSSGNTQQTATNQPDVAKSPADDDADDPDKVSDDE